MWSLSLRQGTTMDTAGAALSLAIIFNSSLALFAALRDEFPIFSYRPKTWASIRHRQLKLILMKEISCTETV